MIYTENEKHRMDSILKAFSDFIREQSYFDIVYSEKVGYIKILAGLCEIMPADVRESAEELMEALVHEVTNEVVYSPNNHRHDRESLCLFEHEEAESRRRLTAIVETMEEERDYWMKFIDRYLKACRETAPNQ